MNRTTHKSHGRKRYAVRDAKGRIRDNQSYKRSSAADQRVTTVAEAERRVVRAAMSVVPITSYAGLVKLYVACRALTEARKAARRNRRAGKGK